MARRTKAEQAKYDAERKEAIAWLRANIKPGQTIYTILSHVSRSIMHRRVHVCTVVDGEIVRLTHRTALALDTRVGKDDALCVDGYGFDAGHRVVYNLGRVLCPCGGYQLRHRWLA